jgi:hypothetical protein
MSYEKVKSIKIDTENNRVLINCVIPCRINSTCNNTSPLNFKEWDCIFLSEILKTKGLTATKTEILKLFLEGEFQNDIKPYSTALRVINTFLKEEYKPYVYNWSDNSSNITEEKRKSPEFYALLEKALNYKLPKERFVITSLSYGGLKCFGKLSKRFIKWRPETEKATKFISEEEAREEFKHFNSMITEKWKIMRY